MLKKEELRKVYTQYGFKESKTNELDVVVFTYQSGHFHNADIIKLSENSNDEKAFEEFKRAGYACKIRDYKNIKDVESTLFKGFFSVESTKNRLKREYEKHAESIAKAHVDNGTYKYINSRYYINEKLGEKDVVSEIYERLAEKKPILFLVEAAAGFGKTCTAYELLQKLLESDEDMVPLFSELSRNRQAKIFRYVLLDEIDRSFPSLSSRLVNHEIQHGRVPVILDGFDELLHKSKKNTDNDNYNSTEPMLDTIGELLTNSAKVILTTRRTAIFDGDDFHEWVEKHNIDFEVFRIRINEPTISDWIQAERLAKLSQVEFPIERLNNPVLLSYLRCIPDDLFEQSIEDPNLIADKYFNSILERERKRQDLRMIPSIQYEIFKHLAKDMLTYNYTSESRDYISDVIFENFQNLVDETRKQYSADERPTADEIVAKLAGHALLDKNSEDGKSIGFVNEFVLGSFCSELIVSDFNNEWVGDSRFLEPAVVSAITRNTETKLNFWKAIQFVLEFESETIKFLYTLKLTGSIDIDFTNASVEDLEIKDIDLGEKSKLENVIFIGCTFNSVLFHLTNLKNITFVNCRFFDCSVTENPSQNIQSLGCYSEPQDFLNFITNKVQNDEFVDENSLTQAEVFVLEKFWPKGRPTFFKHRPIKGICSNTQSYPQLDIVDAISKLKKRKFLLQPDKISFLELNIDFIGDIKKQLGRV